MAEQEQAVDKKQSKDAEAGQPAQIAINKIYIKDASYESPNARLSFQNKWDPELNMDIQMTSSSAGEDLHEVVLFVTVTVKSADEVAFVAEVKQAGLFTVKGMEGEQLQQVLGIVCTSQLYPYARESLSNLVMKGGFPQLVLAPINFEALYMQHKKQKATEDK